MYASMRGSFLPIAASSHLERLGRPRETQLARRAHVAEQRARGHDGRTGEVALAADAHAVRPVAVERRDRLLPGLERVGPLPEAGPAPRLADAAADAAE